MAEPAKDPIRLRSDLPVYRIDDGTCGSDRLIAHAAWVEDPFAPRPAAQDRPEDRARVIGSMMKGRHGTPFEKGLMTVYVEAPVVVWWEWTRHRFMGLDTEDFSFSLDSGRYKVLAGQFYVPPQTRPLAEPSGFKPMRPVLADGGPNLWHLTDREMGDAAREDWDRYKRMLAGGVAREVARLTLPFNIYYAGYVSANPRTWLNFFSLRRHVEGARHVSFPQWEIDSVAAQCEELFRQRWPATLAAFNEHGRVAP